MKNRGSGVELDDNCSNVAGRIDITPNIFNCVLGTDPQPAIPSGLGTIYKISARVP